MSKYFRKTLHSSVLTRVVSELKKPHCSTYFCAISKLTFRPKWRSQLSPFRTNFQLIFRTTYNSSFQNLDSELKLEKAILVDGQDLWKRRSVIRWQVLNVSNCKKNKISDSFNFFLGTITISSIL